VRMTERSDGHARAADIFHPVAPDSVRMCSGPCGEVKLCTSFPTVSGKPGARYGECRACRDNRLGRGALVRTHAGVDDDPKGFPAGGRRATIRDQRLAIAETVREVMVVRRGQATTFNELYEEVFDRVAFVPAEADVRASVRDLLKSDERCVKLGRDAFAWVLPGEAAPPPPAPPHVVEMIERRWQGLTLDEIGAEFGVTRERVRQLLKKHGGPTAVEIRELRASEARSAQRAHEEAIAGAIRGVLDARGPMTVAEMTEATNLDAGDVSKCWPKELGHLRLHSSGTYESRWSDEEILDAIRDAALYEFPLTTSAYAELLSQGQITGPSTPRISQRFGSWTAACDAAGVVAGQTMRSHYESRWSDDDLLRIVRQYLLDLEAPSSAAGFDEWKRTCAPDGPSFQTLRNRFGSWTEVKRRALAQEGWVE